MLNIIVLLLWSDCSLPGDPVVTSPNRVNEAQDTSNEGHSYEKKDNRKRRKGTAKSHFYFRVSSRVSSFPAVSYFLYNSSIFKC